MTTMPLAVFRAGIDRDARRALVEGREDLEGIDFVEVLSNHVGTPGHVAGAPAQRTLLVHLLNGIGGGVPAGIRADRVAVTGGVRADPGVNPVGVEWAYPALAVAGAPADGELPEPNLPGVSPADRQLVNDALPEPAFARARVLVVRTTTSGDTVDLPAAPARQGWDRRAGGLRRAVGPGSVQLHRRLPERPGLRRTRSLRTGSGRLAGAGLPGAGRRGAARPTARPAGRTGARAGPTGTRPTRR